MSSEKKSLSNFWRAVAWTGVYVFVMWAILRGLFNFDIFSVAHLTKLLHLQLHGFAGFVFGILVLAAVPLYVATTVLTVRNKEMPVKLPLPKCFTDVPPVPTPAPVVPVVTANETLPQLRAGVPPEMRETFMRAKKNYGARQMSVFNRPNAPVKANQTELVPEPITESVAATKVEDVPAYGGIPIPKDFDIDVSAETSNDVPVFADINFDDDNASNDTAKADENPTEKVCAWLRAAGADANVVGDLIIANGCAIAVHDDDDFWVPDELDWFAAGKQKPSPIVELKKAASEQNLKPILYLVTNSIMDIDEKSAEWIADGIMVVTDEDDLRKVLV